MTNLTSDSSSIAFKTSLSMLRLSKNRVFLFFNRPIQLIPQSTQFTLPSAHRLGSLPL